MSAKTLGLTDTQYAWARRIVARIKQRGFGSDGPRIADIALATVLVETGLYMYANKGNPESLRLPHDRVGSDFDSVGLFQQRPKYWGTTAELMDVETSTDLFVDALRRLPWHDMTNGEAAQKVQVSAYPDRYAAQDARAQRIRIELWKEKDMPLDNKDKKWLQAEIRKAVQEATGRNGLKLSDMIVVDYESNRFGKKGVRSHGTATASQESRLGEIQLLLRQLVKDNK